MELTEAQLQLLRAIEAGVRLKDHRDMDGRKRYLLHPLGGAAMPVDAGLVHGLADAGLISSNKKFPSATYWLTDAGRRALGHAG